MESKVANTNTFNCIKNTHPEGCDCHKFQMNSFKQHNLRDSLLKLQNTAFFVHGLP